MAGEGPSTGRDEESGPEDMLPSGAAFDPAAAALAMHLARGDAGLTAQASAYFAMQTRLVSIQTEHLHEQRAVQMTLSRLKRFSDRLRIAIQLFLICVAGVIGLYLLSMLHDAIMSRRVVVEPFEAPPEMAGRGINGRVVAADMLDRFVQLQAATRTSVTKRALANSWTGDIRLEVPETGLSIGDIEQFLHAKFGADIHIGGDLVRTEQGGLALTVRGDQVSPRSFTGAAGDLQPLIDQAADYVYGQTQPALFAVYLLRAGRNAEVVAFARQAFSTTPAEERPFLLNAWADALGNLGVAASESLALEKRALALKPDYWTAYGNAILDASYAGDQEAAWHIGRAMLERADGRTGPELRTALQDWDYLTDDILAERAAVIADQDAHAGIGSSTVSDSATIADLDMELHDPEGARQLLPDLDAGDASARAIAHSVRARMAREAGDTATAWREIQAWGAANADPAVSQGDPSYHCGLVPFAEAAGHPDVADAEALAGGHQLDCARFHADTLDHRGQWQAAQQAYRAAVAMAPDLPGGYFSWGLALARHHDPQAALARLADAHRRGPGWADPLKASADVLAALGRKPEAARAYQAALRHAPDWQAIENSPPEPP